MNGIPRSQLLLGLLLLVLLWGGSRACGSAGEGLRSGAGSTGDQDQSRALTGGRGQVAPRQSGADPQIVALEMELLDKKPGTFQPGRDPFRFAPKKPRQRPQPPPRKRPTPQPRPTERVAEATPPPTRRPPEIDFVYLGSFGTKEQRIAVFSDGEEITNALAGDLLKGQFLVAKIGFESVDIGFKDFPDTPPRRLSVGG